MLESLPMIARLLLAAFLTLIALALWASTTARTSDHMAEPTPAQAAADTHMVARVLDGDTIVLAGGEKVRYIGIDAPELYGGRDAECFARQAQKRNQVFVLGKRVRLEKDTSDTDKYGRLLRYVYVQDPLSSVHENTSINEILVREGYARARSYPPDMKHQPIFTQAETAARAQKLGFWAEGVCDK